MRTEEDRQKMREVGQRLRWLREAMDAPQRELAETIGVHQTAWSKYETGERFPDQFEMVRIVSKLKISKEYLLEASLDGVERNLAIRLAAMHPELVLPRGKEPRKDTDQT